MNPSSSVLSVHKHFTAIISLQMPLFDVEYTEICLALKTQHEFGKQSIYSTVTARFYVFGESVSFSLYHHREEKNPSQLISSVRAIGAKDNSAQKGCGKVSSPPSSSWQGQLHGVEHWPPRMEAAPPPLATCATD